MAMTQTYKHQLRHHIQAFGRDERGASAIEFAMLSSVLLLLLVLVTDYALIMYRKLELTSATRTGAQYALVNTTTASDALIQAAVTGATTLTGVTVTVDRDLCGCSDGTSFACSTVGASCPTATTTGRMHYYTSATASYTYNWLFPAYNTGTKVITASSTIRTQ